MLVKFIMRDADGSAVAGTPTVTADGSSLTPTSLGGNRWSVNANLGTLVTATLEGAVPLDILMPSVDPSTLALNATVAKDTTVAKDATVAKAASIPSTSSIASAVWQNAERTLTSYGEIPAPFAITEATQDTSGNTLGICVDSYGSPQPGVRVDAYLGSTLAYGPVFSAMDGSFNLTVERGYTYTVRFTKTGAQAAVATVTAPAA